MSEPLGYSHNSDAGLDDYAAARREAEVLERLWGWQTCDGCGQVMILGEPVIRSRRDGADVKLCFACAATPAAPLAAVRELPDRRRARVWKARSAA